MNEHITGFPLIHLGGVLVWMMAISAKTPAQESVSAVYYGSGCYVHQMQVAQGRAFLQVSDQRAQYSTVAVLQGDTLQPWAGVTNFINIQSIGRSRDERLIIAQKNLSGGFVFCLIDVERPPEQRISKVVSFDKKSNQDECRPIFLPSELSTFVTNHRIQRLDSPEACIPLSRPVDFEYADVSKQLILAAASAKFNHTTLVKPSEFFWINAVSGLVSNCTLNGVDLSTAEITGICADPSGRRVFYVAIGDRLRGGKLVRVDETGRCEVAHQKTIPFASELAGIPGKASSKGPSSENKSYEEPVLGVCLTEQRRLYFYVPSGVYELKSNDEVALVAAPEYHCIGGFYIARNIPDVILALSWPCSSENDAARFRSKAIMAAFK